MVVIGVAILVVLILIGLLWQKSQHKDRFEKATHQANPSSRDPESIQIEGSTMESIVQAQLTKYALCRKEQIPFIEKS